FKARDLDFRAALDQATSAGSQTQRVSVFRSHPRHVRGLEMTPVSLAVSYRVAEQPSLDGNTVDTHVEKSQYMTNALYMQATLRFLDDRISGIKSAFRGD
ncbi:MAG: flagellar basal body rod protein FlgB, partial [Gammaproteobacteria bacterium]